MAKKPETQADTNLDYGVIRKELHIKSLPKEYEWRGRGTHYSTLSEKSVSVYQKKDKKARIKIVKTLEKKIDKWSKEIEGWIFSNEGIIIKADWLGYREVERKRVYFSEKDL